MAKRRRNNRDKINIKNKIMINISYNPYTYEFKIPEVEFNGNSKLKELIRCNESKNLQTWYKELFLALSEELNSKTFSLIFSGRYLDYIDIEDEVFILNNNNEGWDLNSKFTETIKDDLNMFEKLEKFVLNLKKNTSIELMNDLKSSNAFEIFSKEKMDTFISVVATMSTGKSTLINAMLGENLLPSKSEACTSTICHIKGISGKEKFRGKVDDLEGNNIHEWRDATSEFLEKINEKGNENGLNIYLEGNIPGISSQEINLTIVDTPGPNNSQNIKHRKSTLRFIKDNEKKPLILYVLDSGYQTTDNDNLLNDIVKEIQNNGRQAEERFIFAINKIDQIDYKEYEELIENIKKYLQNKGIKNPKLFPISSEFAKFKRMSLKETLNKSTQKKLNRYEEDFDTEDEEFKDTIKHASIPNKIKNKLYEEAKLDSNKTSLHYSGISAIEEYINLYILKYARVEQIKGAITNIITVLFAKHSDLSLMLDNSDKDLENILKSIEKIKKELGNIGKTQIEETKKKIKNIKSDNKELDRLTLETGKVFTEMDEKFKNGIKIEKQEAHSILKVTTDNIKNLLLEIETTTEDYLKKEVKNKTDKIINMLKSYFHHLLDDSKIDIKLSKALKTSSNVEILNVDKIILKNITARQDKIFSHTEWDPGFWPWEWFEKRDVYKNKTVEEVNLSNIWDEELYPLKIQIAEKLDITEKVLKEKISEIKKIGIKKIDALEKTINAELEKIKNRIDDKNQLEKDKERLKVEVEAINLFIKELEKIIYI